MVQQEPTTGRARIQEVQPGQVVKKPEVIDDFLRNFFIKMSLSRTCECFEAEWYELKATGRLDSSTTVPDVYLRNAVSPGSSAGTVAVLKESAREDPRRWLGRVGPVWCGSPNQTRSLGTGGGGIGIKPIGKGEGGGRTRIRPPTPG